MSFHTGLTFDTLRGANEARLPQFKDRLGVTAHAKTDGSDWSPAEWLAAITGELGELAGELKKARRGDYGQATRAILAAGGDATQIDSDVIAKIGKEAADVAIYLDLFCKQFEIDLGEAITEKFNEVSERVGSSVYINDGDWHHVTD